MSKRSGQSGQVFLRHGRWIERFYIDVPGQSKRVRKAVVLGMKNEITKSQAKLKLKTILSDEGVNTATTFGAVAEQWEQKRLPQVKDFGKWIAVLDSLRAVGLSDDGG
jgi:hypothetical protein